MAAAPPRSPGLGLTGADVEALGLTCKAMWEDIGPQQYCEFRCAPSGIWVSAQFSADVVRKMRREQFAQYLQTWRDIVEMKEDCGATARTLADRGPPMWITDSSGLPLPHGQSHVDRLWFMGDADGTSTAVSAALDGAPIDPSTRARLAELHRQVYAYFSQVEGAGKPIKLPECSAELRDASLCSEALRNHVKWLQKRFEPLRSSDGAACETTRRSKVAEIGSKIPSKYRANRELTIDNGRTGDERSNPHASAAPTALASVNSAVRPANTRQTHCARARPVRRVHSLALVLAILASTVAVLVLERKLTRGAMRLPLRPGGQVQVLSSMSVPSVQDFRSLVSQWAGAGAQTASTAGAGTVLTRPSLLAAALGNSWSILRQRLMKLVS